ncbi:MAG: endopeptidase La [Crocinitomicaceae bacterium]|nr:endopeptidase La [Crocinitomicaceae bacterium]MDP4867041.1 endopeptidase La [Crocinitomicaceae bacterium]
MSDLFDTSILQFTDGSESDAEFIPLITAEEEERMNKQAFPEELPILPLRNNVLFPGVVIPITVGRDKSIKLIQDANKGNKIIGVVSQKNQEEESPEFADLHLIGTVAQIIRTLRMPDGSTTVIIQGKRRFEIVQPTQTEPYMCSIVKMLEEKPFDKKNKELDVMIKTIKDMSLQIIRDSPNIPSEASFAIGNIDSPSFLVNFISSNMNADVNKKQEMLEELDMKKRVMMVLEHLSMEVQMLEMKNEIQSRVKKDMDRQQREYFLHQQMRTIQDELGYNPQEQDVRDMDQRADKKKWDEKVAKLFQKELDKLGRMNPQGAEYTVQLNYLELLLDLPWREYSTDNLDLNRARKILERDHFGLEKVKERILEYLAVLKLKGNMKSPILCFYGPPGVGKTSLGKSIAEALGRKYVRMSLGGLHDESEIRGHRKTYIGAMPGRIIQSIKKAESANPVFVLDEIDKLGRSNHGDPSSALLEVLDPEQNKAFYDNFVETEFDLSRVMFVATANSLSTIQGPLRDRMEIIEVNGYTIEEKIEIAKLHLLPKQIEEHGITKKVISIDKKTLERLIEEYTNESGVRGLDKMVAKLVRNRARQIAMEEEYVVKITPEDLFGILGAGRGRTKYENNDVAGVVTGLAWTSVGGDILFIESSITKGKGKLTLTGNLGDVMKESAIIALEFLKAHNSWLSIEQEAFDRYNVHIHVPEGATPKDGPSAGITMLTSLASLFTQRRVKKNLAMTGEITLRGEVLPVGGIKEKILAAKRAGIKEIILCEKNRKDIDEIKQDYLKGLTFHFVTQMKEVIDIALTNEKVKQPIEIA